MSSSDDEEIDWYIVEGLRGRNIGALGFMDDEVKIITSFYDDRDRNMDGTVSIPERVVKFISPDPLWPVRADPRWTWPPPSVG